MTSSYTTNLHLEKPANGDDVNTWDVPVNADWDVLDAVLGNYTSINVVSASGTVALTLTQYRPRILVFSGALTANVNYQLPSGIGGTWSAYNNTSGAYTLTMSSAGAGTTVTLPQGYSTIVFCDGTNVRIAGGAAAGSTGQVQYNSGGGFAGAPLLTYDAANGRVGVGTAGPSYTLEVVGTFNASTNAGPASPINGVSGLGVLPSASFTNNGSGSTVLGVTSSITSSGNNTSSYHFAGITQSVAIWYLYGNGTTSYTSDERTKENIRYVESGCLDRILRLRVAEFDRRSPEDIDLDNPGPRRMHDLGGPEPTEVGLIAQDVEEVFPEFVETAIHDLEGELSDKTRSLMIKGDLIYGPMLLVAVQELAQRVKDLEQKLAGNEG